MYSTTTTATTTTAWLYIQSERKNVVTANVITARRTLFSSRRGENEAGQEYTKTLIKQQQLTLLSRLAMKDSQTENEKIQNKPAKLANPVSPPFMTTIELVMTPERGAPSILFLRLLEELSEAKTPLEPRNPSLD